MEPIYNQDGTLWDPGKEYWKNIERRMKPVLKRIREKEERHQAQIVTGNTIWLVILFIAILVHIVLDGYAIRHGQIPMFFGR